MLGILGVKDAENVLLGKTFVCRCVHFGTVFGGFLALKNRARYVYLQTEPRHLFRNDLICGISFGVVFERVSV